MTEAETESELQNPIAKSYRERKKSGLSGLSLRFDASYGSGTLHPIKCRYGLSRGHRGSAGSDVLSSPPSKSSSPGFEPTKNDLQLWDNVKTLQPWENTHSSSASPTLPPIDNCQSDIVLAAENRHIRNSSGRTVKEADRALGETFTIQRSGGPSLASLAQQYDRLPRVTVESNHTDQLFCSESSMKRRPTDRKIRKGRNQGSNLDGLMIQGHSISMAQQDNRAQQDNVPEEQPQKLSPIDKARQVFKATFDTMKTEMMSTEVEEPEVEPRRSSPLLEREEGIVPSAPSRRMTVTADEIQSSTDTSHRAKMTIGAACDKPSDLIVVGPSGKSSSPQHSLEQTDSTPQPGLFNRASTAARPSASVQMPQSGSSAEPSDLTDIGPSGAPSMPRHSLMQADYIPQSGLFAKTSTGAPPISAMQMSQSGSSAKPSDLIVRPSGAASASRHSLMQTDSTPQSGLFAKTSTGVRPRSSMQVPQSGSSAKPSDLIVRPSGAPSVSRHSLMQTGSTPQSGLFAQTSTGARSSSSMQIPQSGSSAKPFHMNIKASGAPSASRQSLMQTGSTQSGLFPKASTSVQPRSSMQVPQSGSSAKPLEMNVKPSGVPSASRQSLMQTGSTPQSGLFAKTSTGVQPRSSMQVPQSGSSAKPFEMNVKPYGAPSGSQQSLKQTGSSPQSGLFAKTSTGVQPRSSMQVPQSGSSAKPFEMNVKPSGAPSGSQQSLMQTDSTPQSGLFAKTSTGAPPTSSMQMPQSATSGLDKWTVRRSSVVITEGGRQSVVPVSSLGMQPPIEQLEVLDDDNLGDIPAFDGGGGAMGGSAVKGEPIDESTATQLKEVMFGSASMSFNPEWTQQNLSFNTTENITYGIVQHKGGPCGVLAVVQAYVMKMLQFGSQLCGMSPAQNALRPTPAEQRAALAASITEILLKCGHGSATVALSSGRSQLPGDGRFKCDGVTETLQLERFTAAPALLAYVQQQLSLLMSPSGSGCVLLTYSAVLSRGIEGTKEDMDVPTNTVIGQHGYCTQELVNLLLTGTASSNVFNGTTQLGEGNEVTVLKGIQAQSEIGLLSLFEHYKSCEVGSHLKSPAFPIWVILSESHFTCLFCNDRQLSRDPPVGGTFDLYYYDMLAKQDDQIRLTVEYDGTPGADPPAVPEGQLVPPLEHCIRTRWNGATIDWNGYEPIL